MIPTFEGIVRNGQVHLKGAPVLPVRTSSLIRCDKLMTLNRTLLSGRLGLLSVRLMTEVNARLCLALDLNSD